MKWYATHRVVGLCLFLVVSGSLGIQACQSSASDPVVNSAASTLPVKALPTSLTFFAMGDWVVYGLLRRQEVANQMETFAPGLTPSFLVMAGDNFYQIGVSSISDPQWKIYFKNIYTGTRL